MIPHKKKFQKRNQNDLHRSMKLMKTTVFTVLTVLIFAGHDGHDIRCLHYRTLARQVTIKISQY